MKKLLMCVVLSVFFAMTPVANATEFVSPVSYHYLDGMYQNQGEFQAMASGIAVGPIEVPEYFKFGGLSVDFVAVQAMFGTQQMTSAYYSYYANDYQHQGHSQTIIFSQPGVSVQMTQTAYQTQSGYRYNFNHGYLN
jgi:hypothetical protein